MSNVLSELTDECTCAICLSLFESPVTLDCGHSFCRGCLQRMVDVVEDGEEEQDDPVCPACRAEELPDDLDSVPNTTALANAAEALRCVDVMRCNCTEVPHLALWYCLTCDAHTCDKQAILAAGAHRGHDIDEQSRIEAESRSRAEAAEATRLMWLTAAGSQNDRIDSAFAGLSSRVSAVATRARDTSGPAGGTRHAMDRPAAFQSELETAIERRCKDAKGPTLARIASLDDLGVRLRTIVDALPRLDGQRARLQGIESELSAVQPLEPFDSSKVAAWLENLPKWRALEKMASSQPRPIQCFVVVNVNKRQTISIMLPTDSDLEDLQEIVYSRTQVPSRRQLIMWHGRVVDETTRLRDALRYGERNGGGVTLELSLRTAGAVFTYSTRVTFVFMRTTNGSLCKIAAKPTTTVQQLKERFEALKSIPPALQTLEHRDQMLNQDNLTMANCNVQDGDTINVWFERSKPDAWGDKPPVFDTNVKVVYVNHIGRSAEGHQYEIEAEPETTVLELKELVEAQQGISAAQQRYIWKGQELEDEYTMANYNVQDEAVIELVVCQSQRGSNGEVEEQDDAEVMVNDFNGWMSVVPWV